MTASATNGKSLEAMFDEGVDMTDFIIESETRFPGQDETARKISISMPEWMIGEVDAMARRYGNTRQGMINVWVGERLTEEKKASVV